MDQGYTVLKENETCIVFDADGGCNARAAGIYRRDTRYLSHYAWTVAGEGLQSQVLQCGILEGRLVQCVALKRDMGVVALLERELVVRHDGFDERWQITQHGAASTPFTLSLAVVGDGRDLFAVFSEKAEALSTAGMNQRHDAQGLWLERTASDGVEMRVHVAGAPADLLWALQLAPGERRAIDVSITLQASDDPVDLVDPADPADAGDAGELPSYADWRARHTTRLAQHGEQAVLDRAIDDLRMLMLRTDHGLYPAAGMPHFVTVFGRDALITSMMLLPTWPQVAEGVLRYLAAHQGRVVDAFREEEPGKILHEMRRGELSRTGRVPFGRYYGSVDSTPLFLMALAEHRHSTGSDALMHALRPAWEAAVEWLVAHQPVAGGADDGLIAFQPSGSGLLVQSWKDSSESMVHADGRQAKPPLAVAEVQGYAFAAFGAVAGFCEALGDTARADAYHARARLLAEVFDRRFWLDDLGTYAMALDGALAPLRVLSSDPGHLLWCGIVPPERAARLVTTLMSPALWSGWGLRTLGSNEQAFNPVSYHNGSVWPHDTALFAAGLARYGFNDQLQVVTQALFDLAASQPLGRLPELVSGHSREPGLGPVQYTHACRPQAWAAAALPFLARLRTAASQPSAKAQAQAQLQPAVLTVTSDARPEPSP